MVRFRFGVTLTTMEGPAGSVSTQQDLESELSLPVVATSSPSDPRQVHSLSEPVGCDFPMQRCHKNEWHKGPPALSKRDQQQAIQCNESNSPIERPSYACHGSKQS